MLSSCLLLTRTGLRSALLLWRFFEDWILSACSESVCGDEVAAFEIVGCVWSDECVGDEVVSGCMSLFTLGVVRVWPCVGRVMA